jgi:VanZ family protein
MTRLVTVAAWAVIGYIAYATLSPLSARPHLAGDPNIERFLAYASAGALLALAYPRHAMRVACFTVAVAIGLEGLQTYAVNRHPGLIDTVVKVTGGIVGVCLARVVMWLLMSRRRA